MQVCYRLRRLEGAPGMLQSSIATEIHDNLHMIEDVDGRVIGVIAIHSTAIGPAAGGCRLWPYDDEGAMMRDALRLARGMSYKNALAGLPFGGGKAVLRRPLGAFDRPAYFHALARSVSAMSGSYITAEDVGTTVEDMRLVSETTRFVAGLDARGGLAGGDPSPWTALGVFQSMQAAAQLAFGTNVKGLTVAMQGAGNVGSHLCELLVSAGAKLIVADVDPVKANALAARCNATVVSPEDILSVPADILAPCALGGILDRDTISRLQVSLICGGANNQLATAEDGDLLVERGIVYAPDYVVNAGGIINVAAEYLGENFQRVAHRVSLIAPRLIDILEEATLERRPPQQIADRMAERLIAAAHPAA
jgi:leucine dehydrogenase